MADYVVPAGHVGVHEKTLAAATVDTVTFQLGSASSPGWASRLPRAVEILSDGADDIYATTDGSTPTVTGTNCYRVPAAAGSTVIDVSDDDPTDEVVVKLISAGAPTYSGSRAGPVFSLPDLA